MFLNMDVLQGGVISTSSNPQAGGPPLVGSPRLLIQFIRSYPPYRRPFLYPQPEDAPCRGDRDPLQGRGEYYLVKYISCGKSRYWLCCHKNTDTIHSCSTFRFICWCTLAWTSVESNKLVIQNFSANVGKDSSVMEAVSLAERIGSLLKLALNKYFWVDELGSVNFASHDI